MRTTQLLQDRPDVMGCIDSELEHQNIIAEKWSDGLDHGIEGQILTLEEYTREARRDWVLESDPTKALAQLRKCAAIAVRALMMYGAPMRQVGEATKRR